MEQTRNCGNNGFDMYNIGDRCEYVQYAIEIERTLHNMQKELNTCIDPRKAAMLIMRVATEFYDADWCGILDVDMEIGVWTPIWWYDTEFGEMAQTKFEEFELSEKYGFYNKGWGMIFLYSSLLCIMDKKNPPSASNELPLRGGVV